MKNTELLYNQIISSLVHLHTCRESVMLFRPEVKHILKKVAGNLDNYLGTTIATMSGQLGAYIDKERLKTYIDDTAAVHMEVLDQVEKAKDKRELLAMIRAYNDGLIKMEEE